MTWTVNSEMCIRDRKITGLGAIPVIAVAGHDTGSAVAAVPALDRNFAYLSSLQVVAVPQRGGTQTGEAFLSLPGQPEADTASPNLLDLISGPLHQLSLIHISNPPTAIKPTANNSKTSILDSTNLVLFIGCLLYTSARSSNASIGMKRCMI